MDKTHIIGEYCRDFRINVLKMTLKEVAGETSFKTLSGFENGRSTNIEHMKKYIVKCETHELREQFIKGLIDALEKDDL